MRKNLILTLLVPFFVACTDDNGAQEANQVQGKTYSSQSEAEQNSPVGESCLVSGEYKEVEECMPTNRGKNGNCEWRTIVIDTRIYEPAYLIGDIDNDGVAFTRDDAQLATKRIYVKQIESQPCPAQADIAPFAGIHDGYEADGYLTSNDVNKWQDVKRGERPTLGGVICQSQCSIINHMSPDYK